MPLNAELTFPTQKGWEAQVGVKRMRRDVSDTGTGSSEPSDLWVVWGREAEQNTLRLKEFKECSWQCLRKTLISNTTPSRAPSNKPFTKLIFLPRVLQGQPQQ